MKFNKKNTKKREKKSKDVNGSDLWCKLELFLSGAEQ
jgi:hypothetical protein